ncbi:MAG: sigma-54 dependent transcriptional regulator, partial [Candidatus Zixiibacteriota bacterium]
MSNSNYGPENNDEKSVDPTRHPDNDSFPFLAAVKSQVFHKVLEIAKKVARFNSSVLIRGETGVGKEVVARYIHNTSPRAKNLMLAINCGAFPETLLESELFGHKAGSFTGAIKDRVGIFEQAARGTILLDEIGDVSQVTQLKLLRVFQEREILRIGENIPRKVDTRIISATNRNLEKVVLEGKFREDLLYRLRVIEIRIPPLRERPEDIISLTEYFIKRLIVRLELPNLNLNRECLEYFQAYQWPGNVRELRNAIEQAAILSENGNVRPEHLPPHILNPDFHFQRFDMSKPRTLKDMESEYIKVILKLSNGNKARAARTLGIGQA